jgi:hypothetical protein
MHQQSRCCSLQQPPCAAGLEAPPQPDDPGGPLRASKHSIAARLPTSACPTRRLVCQAWVGSGGTSKSGCSGSNAVLPRRLISDTAASDVAARQGVWVGCPGEVSSCSPPSLVHHPSALHARPGAPRPAAPQCDTDMVGREGRLPDVSGGQINAATDVRTSSARSWAGHLQAAQLTLVLWVQDARRSSYGGGTCRARDAADVPQGWCCWS